MSTTDGNKKNLRQRGVELLNKINFYEDDESLELNDQLLSTRIYFVLLFISMSSLIIFTGSSVQTIVITVTSPNEQTFKQFSIDYSPTLVCPCSRISIPYGQFLSFSPEYHQICTSDFIHSTWISSLFNLNMSYTYPLDFRLIASSQFEMIRSFCQISNETINDILQSFGASKVITSNTLFPTTFNQQMTALIDQLQSMTVADNTRMDRILSLSIAQNRIFSGLRTNFYGRNVPGTNAFATYSAVYSKNFTSIPSEINQLCYCSDDFNCHFPSALFNTSLILTPFGTLWPYSSSVFFVPGIETGCIPRTSLSQSTFECLFDQICLNRIVFFIQSFALVKPLNVINSSSRYQMKTTIEDIFQNLMIESWHEKKDFTAYYRACAPQLCTYSYARRFSLVYMMTTLLGLVGGLTVVIHILCPLLIKFTCRRQQQQQPPVEDINLEQPQLNPQGLITKILSFLRTKFITLNLFKNTSLDIRHETYSTRLYILLLIIAFVILTIYLAIIQTTQSVTIDNPSVEIFEELYRDYSSTLSCPCEYLSTKYSNLMFIQSEYHQICSSVFLQNQWLKYWPLNEIDPSNTNVSALSGQDFRITGQSFFNLLQIFCQFASETIDNALIVFNSSDFVAAQPLGRNEFNIQTSSLINQFIKTTSQSFDVRFQLISNSIRLNQFLVLGYTNAVPRFRLNNGIYQLRYIARTFIKENRTCSCDTSSQCTRSQGFFCQTAACKQGNALPTWPILGLNIGCFPIDSILLSTLECFFNQSCIQMLINLRLYDFDRVYLPVNITNITALNLTRPSQYFPNTTFETIISQLFVENWTTRADFLEHYHHCQPKFCTYTFIERYQPVFIITSVIGLMGGLTVVFELFVPVFVQIVLRLFRRRRRDVFHLHLFEKLRQLNIYQQDAVEGDHPLIATRIYIVLLLITLVIVSVFISLQQQTYSFTVDFPIESEFRSLNEKYSSTLSCSCSQLAVRYETFLHLSPTLHQICSSDFIHSNWSSTLANKGDIWNTPDWFLLSTQYRLLSSMCQLSEKILNQSISKFLSEQLINTETLSSNSFHQQIDSAMILFLEQLPKEFRRTLSFIHQTFRSNQFIDRYMSTWQVTHSNLNESYILRWKPIQRSNHTCICAAGMSSCSKSLSFFDTFNRTITLPGFVDGCLPMDGLRQSTFECLFDDTCLNRLTTLINYPTNLLPLNRSQLTRYSFNTTLIGTIIDQLFVELWSNSSNYTAYFSRCAPLTCEYSYVERNDIVYIITTILGLYGGLTNTVQLIVWHGMKFLQRCRHRGTQIASSF